MEENSLVSHAGELITAAAAATAFAFTWIIYRSASWHILKLRLWRLAHGKGESNDRQLRSAIDALTNLTAFRFHFYKTSNWPEAKAIMVWADSQNLDLGTLHACGNYFNPKTCTFRAPSILKHRARIGLGLGMLVLWVLMVGIIEVGAIPRAFVTFDNTGQWVALGKENAKLLFQQDAVKLSKDDCSRSPADLKETHFSAGQVSTLCTFFNKSTSARFVDDNVKLQRIAAGFTGSFLGYVLLCIRLAWLRMNAAWSLQDLLKKEERSPGHDESRMNRKSTVVSENRLLRFGRARRGEESVYAERSAR